MTSVLFADLVSYTSLSESRDTEDVRELLSEYFDVCSTVVRRYGGSVEKFIGDAVMAVWGVPTAYEDDAERAVRAGLELVEQVAVLGERLGIAELALRAGVVTGEVAANLGATDQGMVAGDPVNTAARIQSVAGAGQVWVDATTRTLSAAAVTYFDAGTHALKGKAEPVQLFRAGSVVAVVGGSQRVDGLEAPLVGRERQVRLVKELFHGCEESGRPTLVILDGEPGVGKSRLGWEFEKYIDGLHRTVRWHRGRCLSYGEGVAFWALAEAVRARVDAVEDDTGEAVLAGLDRVLGDVVPDDAERAWLRPRVASLLGEESREFAREDLFAAWARFLDRVGAGNPVVLLIDDAQYADQGLLDFVEHLTGNSSGSLFVLLLARPELLEAHPQLGGRRASVVRLEPLPDAVMADLVEGLVDGLSPEVRDDLVARSEGVPLFAVETVRALVDRDLVQAVGGRYLVAPGARVDLGEVGAPASLHALVAARLDALSPAERRVLTDASVLGEVFTQEGIGVLAADVPALDEVLASLRRKELVATETDRFSSERGQFRFVQSVVRQVAYSTLSKRERKSRHLLVAAHMSGDADRADDLAQVIARHLLDAAESAPDDPDVADLRARAAARLLTAGDRSCALGSYADGVRLFEAALAWIQEPSSRGAVLTKVADAFDRLARPGDAANAAREALRLLEGVDPVAAADAAAMLATALLRSYHDDEAVEVARRWLDRVQDAPEADRAHARLARVRASAETRTVDLDDSSAADEALRYAERSGDHETFASALGMLAAHQAQVGSRRAAGMLFDAQAEFARNHELWDQLSVAQGNTGFVLGPVDMPAAITATEACNETRQAHGLPAAQEMFANQCNWLWLSGRWAELADLLTRASDFPDDVPLAALIAAANDRLRRWADPGPLLTDRGPQAPADVAAGLAQTFHFRDTAEALATGDVAAALAHARDCARAEHEVSGISDDAHVFWPLAVRVALIADDPAALQELLGFVPNDPDHALPISIASHRRVFRALLAVRDGDPDHARIEADLLAGIAGLERYGAVVWRAHAQEDLGAWLASAGRDEDAAPHLEAARTTYAELGATAWLERLDAAALLTGSPARK